MQEHWAKWGPPVYMAVAGYLGWGKDDKAKKPQVPDAEPKRGVPVMGNTSEFGSLEDLANALASTGGYLNG